MWSKTQKSPHLGDCFNGFANRFLWALVRRSKLLPDGGNGLDVVTLQERLATALAAAKKITTMSRSQEARALWHQLYPELTAERPGLFGAVVGRGEAQTLRLSMLYALLDGVGMVRAAVSDDRRPCSSSGDRKTVSAATACPADAYPLLW